MFFAQLMSIGRNDVVLEIGPGAYPHWRSDCLVDRYDNEDGADLGQFGGKPQETAGKPLFKMEGALLPFVDNAFDYVICSHVLEHVDAEELPLLLSEIARVAPRAYIEVPRPVFELVYDFDVHVNLMDIVGNEIVCLPKTATQLASVKNITSYGARVRSRGFAVEQLGYWFVAAGKEMRCPLGLRVFDNEKDFFDVIGSPDPMPPLRFSWRLGHFLARMEYQTFKRHRRVNVERLLK